MRPARPQITAGADQESPSVPENNIEIYINSRQNLNSIHHSMHWLQCCKCCCKFNAKSHKEKKRSAIANYSHVQRLEASMKIVYYLEDKVLLTP